MNELLTFEARFEEIEQELVMKMNKSKENTINIVSETLANSGLIFSYKGEWFKKILHSGFDISNQSFLGIIKAYADVADSDYRLLKAEESKELRRITLLAVNSLADVGGSYSDLTEDTALNTFLSEKYSQPLNEVRAEFTKKKEKYLEENLQTLAIALITTLEELVGE